MIEPTVGRIVWYRPEHDEANSDYTLDFNRLKKGHPLAAMVVGVHTERCVNLVVFDAVGKVHRREKITLLQDGDARPDTIPFAEWMPYQKGQAAKTEQLEAKIGGAS